MYRAMDSVQRRVKVAELLKHFERSPGESAIPSYESWASDFREPEEVPTYTNHSSPVHEVSRKL